MAASQIVLIEGNQLPTIEQIQKEAVSRKYEITIEAWDVDSLIEIEGYWPCQLMECTSGVEFYIQFLEKDDIESLEIEPNLLKGKTHIVEMVFRDEDEYRTAAILTAIFCKLCNGIAFDENQEFKIVSSNAVRWAKKVIKKGFNVSIPKGSKSHRITVIGGNTILENDLRQLLEKELENVMFLGVWAGGIRLEFKDGFGFYSNSWRMLSRKNVFDVTKYRLCREKEMKHWEDVDLIDPTDEQKESLSKYEAANDAAISEDEKTTEKAKKELTKWPAKVTVASVNWNDADTISIRFKEIDGGFDLIVIGELTEISYSTPNQREFHIKIINDV